MPVPNTGLSTCPVCAAQLPLDLTAYPLRRGVFLLSQKDAGDVAARAEPLPVLPSNLLLRNAALIVCGNAQTDLLDFFNMPSYSKEKRQ